MATDGWTNVCGIKVTNVLVLIGGVAFYWYSLYSEDGKTAIDMAPLVAAVIDELLDEGVAVVGLVADNEAVNGAVHRLLNDDFPWLVEVGCASHTIQLVVKEVFKVPSIAALRKYLKSLIRCFLKSKNMRAKLVDFQVTLLPGKRTLKMLRIMPVRWNSDLFAMERVVRLEIPLDSMMHVHRDQLIELGMKPVPADLFASLKSLSSFLKPMQIATDITQSDSASLYDVFTQFQRLRAHARSFSANSPMYEAGQALLAGLDKHWDAHINESAVICCSWLSFHSAEAIANQFPRESITAAKLWFIDFCADYLLHWHRRTGAQDPQLDEMATDIRDSMRELFSSFMVSTEEPWIGLRSLANSKKCALAAAAAEQAAPPADGSLPKIYVHFDAREIWRRLYPEFPEFVQCVSALLSIYASEAAVERAFSAQGKTHSAVRNSLKEESIQNELFMKLNYRALQKRDQATQDKATMFGAWIEVADDADESHILPDESDAEDETDLPANNGGHAAALPQSGPRVEIDSDEKINDNDSVVSESSPADVRHYRWVQETGPSRRELCVAWLETESVKRVINSNFKLRFNGDLDSNLQLFATSNNNNDSLVDLKREARLYLGDEQKSKALESTGAATSLQEQQALA